MRLGRVYIDHSYIVDLDNEDMVKQAEDALYEDIMNAVKFGEVNALIQTEVAPDADEGDIPDFLLDDGDDDVFDELDRDEDID